MCPSKVEQDFSFQGHLGWCRVGGGGWYSLMGKQTGLGCFSFAPWWEGLLNFLTPDFLKWVAACGLSWYHWLLWTSRWWWKSRPGLSLNCCALSPCEWDFHLPFQLLPTEFFGDAWQWGWPGRAPTQPWVLHGSKPYSTQTAAETETITYIFFSGWIALF